MGEVLLARDPRLDRRVVIKRLRVGLSASDDYVTMFLDEARVLAQLNHPNIVRIHELGFTEARHFMVMERLVGWDLRAILNALERAGRFLPVDAVILLASDALAGLHAAHEARTEGGRPLHLVHRDISPANLFITAEGQLKLIDFGVAKTTIQRRQTIHGQVKGKLAYMSPEQVLGQPLDRRSDVFSLGIVLHEMLAGKPLFEGRESEDALGPGVEGPIFPPARGAEPLPEELVRVTMRALHRDLELRYATAAEMGAALSELLTPERRSGVRAELAATLNQLFEGTSCVLRPSLSEAERSISSWVRQPTTVVISSQKVGVAETVTSFESARTVADAPPLPAGSVTRRFASRRWLGAIAAAGALVVAGTILMATRGGPPSPTSDVGAAPPAATVSRSSPGPLPTRPAAVAPASDDVVIESPSPEVEAPAVAHGKNAPPRSSPRAKRPTPTPTPARDREPARPEELGTGRLTLQVDPWVDVYLAGKSLGVTPLVNVEVPAGRLRLRLVNPRFGIDRIEVVEVGRGETVRRTIHLPTSVP